MRQAPRGEKTARNVLMRPPVGTVNERDPGKPDSG
jgi:hypothetical protein